MAVAASIGITVCFAFLRRAVRRAAVRSADWEKIQEKGEYSMPNAAKGLAKKRSDEKLLVSEMIALYCRKQHRSAKREAKKEN